MNTFKLHLRHIAVLFVLYGLASCHKEANPVATSQAVQTYLDQLISEMEQYSINRKTIDWTSFKQQVTNKAQGAQTIADTYPAIELALTLLADNHSSYTTSTGAVLIGSRTIHCTDGTPTAVPANSKIGYVKITAFSGSDDAATNFAQSVQNAIKQADTDSIKGWIVDLRGNTGGNMWPMLAGIGPILGDGIAGYFITPDGAITSWGYQNGSSILGQAVAVSLTNPYVLRSPTPKVAVLTSQVTASSGEAIAISFKTRPNTRSFGSPTCGLSTANATKVLSDGAVLNLTQGAMADRTKTLYGKQVQPDEVLYSAEAVDKAMAWILQ